MKNFIKAHTYEVNHSAHDWQNTMRVLESSRNTLLMRVGELDQKCRFILRIKRRYIESARTDYEKSRLHAKEFGHAHNSLRQNDRGDQRRKLLRKLKELQECRWSHSTALKSLDEVDGKIRKCKRSSLSLYRSPAEPAHIDTVEITRQVKALSFVHSAFFTIRAYNNMLEGRVRFLPFPIQRYNPDEDAYIGAPIIGHPFTLKIRIPANPVTMDLSRVFENVSPRGLPYSRVFPHAGCLGSAEPHLATAARHKDVVNALCIYYSYMCTANVLDPYGSGADPIELHEQDVPSIENLTLHNYRRYTYASPSE